MPLMRQIGFTFKACAMSWIVTLILYQNLYAGLKSTRIKANLQLLRLTFKAPYNIRPNSYILSFLPVIMTTRLRSMLIIPGISFMGMDWFDSSIFIILPFYSFLDSIWNTEPVKYLIFYPHEDVFFALKFR